ncbi:MAG: PAS domain S-box protein [Campylobacterota bacterium]|nr:PAS domain S-box protein [Campylobacterota bacterium]
MNTIKNVRTKEILILILSIIVLVAISFLELENNKNKYLDEKIYDLTLQYNEVVIINKKISEALFDDVLESEAIISLIQRANSDKEKETSREKLYQLLKHKYERMAKKGVLQFHFHLANGESFLRFHKPQKHGGSLLFRDSIKQVIANKKAVYGFEVGRYFGGFRYVYPLFNADKKYIGSVESSISPKYIITQMKESLDGEYSMILNKNTLEKRIAPECIKKYYHSFCADKNYYMANNIYVKNSSITDVLKKIKNRISPELENSMPFAKVIHNFEQHKIVVFIPIQDVANKKIGYFISVRDDANIQDIYVSQLIKFFVTLFFILIIFYFYKQNREKVFIIEQLQNKIDRTTLVSKTDLHGKITYVNDAFVKLSGYSRKELLGQQHAMIRHKDMPKEVFRDLWATIKSDHIWHGKVKNRAKDGSSYTVDATIFPVKNANGETVEYTAIRHNITELEEYKQILKDQLEDQSKSLDEQTFYLKEYEDGIDYSNAIVKTDLNLIIKYVNDSHLKLSKYSYEEMVGHPVTDFVDESSLSNLQEILETIQSGNIYQGIFKGKPKSGEPYFTKTTIKPIKNVNGEIQEYLLIKNNITAIKNLHSEIEETQREVIYKMGEIGESRSKETGHHVKRVAMYSKLFALKYGLSQIEAELLYDASPMHDIGKVAIPDDVLKKPGGLTDDEWVIMKTHSKIGYNVLKGSNRDILKAAATVAHEHHEKYDGSGYPRGLKGEDIHIYGRITALADVFDALGSDRVYKKAWDDEKIFKLLKEQKGTHFDPKLIDIFFDHLDEFLEIRDTFK